MRKLSLFLTLIISVLSYSIVDAQVVINEVMHKPGTSASVNQGMRRKEYVELYNTSCSPVDIGCWIVGSAGMGVQTVNNPSYIGAFQFPAGTSIAPGQHIVVGGTQTQNATGYAAADIDYDVANYIGTNTCDPNTNWLLPNGDGWIALYDDAGVPVDAIFWGFSSTQPTLSTDDDFASTPCVPTACSGVSSLMSARQIQASYPSKITFGGLATGFDKTFSRVPDGGGWQRDILPSIAGSNQCNNGQCSVAASFLIPTAVTQPACGSSNGNITVTPNPTGTYTYTWTPNVSSTNSASGLAANTYAINIVSSTGCTKDTTIVLSSGNAPTAIVVTPTNPSCGQTNGTVVLGNVTGGVGPYQYNFNNAGFAGTLTYNNLASGSYTLVVKDANGCTYTAPNISLTSSNGPTAIAVTPTNPSCGQSNGTIALGNVTGGTSPYQYNFNGQGLSATLTYNNLAAGSYTLIVQDANGCTFNAPNISLSSSNGPTAIAITPTNPSCGQSNGTIALGSVTGGTSPYQYNFNGLGLSATLTYNNLAAGSYTLVVQDANGCSYTAPNISLSSANGPTAIAVTPTNPSCGQSNGTIVLGNVTGGTSPYQYNFNGQGLSATLTYNNLAAGSYTLVVQDANGCAYTAPNIALNSANGPTAITVTPTNPSCGQTNGTVVLGNVTGGTSPYQYNFNGAGLSSTLTYNNLGAGSYTLVVQDAGGCTYTAPNVTLTSSNAPTAIVVTPTNPSCGQSNGTIVLGSVTGGTSPYQYNFNATGLSTNLNYTGLAAGSYTLVVQDANGCVYNAPNIALSNSNGPTAIVVTPTNTNCGQANGAVALGSVTGGTSPYQYNFNGQGLSSTLTYNNLAAGSYTLIVQDANGCSYTAPSITINGSNGPTAIVVTTTNTSCGQPNGAVVLGTVTGGTSPYQYNFNGAGLSSNLSYSNLLAGAYTLVVEDANGCSLNAPVITISNVNTGSIPQVEYTVVEEVCGAGNGSLIINNVYGSNSPFILNFNSLGFSSQTSFDSLSVGQYLLQIKDANGCIFDSLIDISADENQKAFYTPNCFTPNGDNLNDKWNVKGNCIKEIKIFIFNRWGEKIFTITDLANGWDGVYRNSLVSDGVYVYNAEITYYDASVERKIGHITLLK